MRQIASIQALRALAALMVVVGHAQSEATVASFKHGPAFAASRLLPWGAGVDLFFVISGFIMVVSSERLFAQPGAAITFATRRLKRIVPLYWLFTTLAVLVFLAGQKSIGVGDLLASYFFWPRDVFGDGVLRPVLSLGWTLNYEMYFYVLFSLAVVLPRRMACGAVIVFLAAAVCIGQVVPLPPGPLVFWTRPIVLEFALGMGIAIIWRNGVRLPDVARLALAVLGILGLAYDVMGSAHQAVTWTTPTDLTRLLGWGVPGALLVAAAALGRTHSIVNVPVFVVALGDASYALYLVHPFVVLSLARLYLMAGLPDRIGYWPYIGLCVGLAVVCAFLVHGGFEMPLARWLALRRSGGREVASTPRP